METAFMRPELTILSFYVTKNRELMLEQPEEVIIFTTTGQLIYQGFTQSVSLPQSGVYIVRVGNETGKILVK